MTTNPLELLQQLDRETRVGVLIVALMDHLGLKDVAISDSALHEALDRSGLALVCDEGTSGNSIRLRLVTRKEADRIVAEAEKAGRETA